MLLDQVDIRNKLEQFLLENPMSLWELGRGCHLGSRTLNKIRSGEEIKRIKPLLVLLKFMKEYEK